MKLRTDLIRTDGGTQMRVGPYNEDVLKDYEEVMKNGGQLPALTVFQEGTALWLADGFHRLKAYKNLSIREVEADVREGSKRDAILFAVGANASHGLRRTNADKRRAVETLLKDQEWRGWSDRKISEMCGVGNKFVGDVRRAICVPDTDRKRIVERGGTVYEQSLPQRQEAEPHEPEAPSLISVISRQPLAGIDGT